MVESIDTKCVSVDGSVVSGDVNRVLWNVWVISDPDLLPSNVAAGPLIVRE